MPWKPKKPCAYPGCRELTVNRYCEQHQKLMDKRYDAYERSPVVKKRYGRAWKRIRDRYIGKHPLCEMCLKTTRPLRQRRCTISVPSPAVAPMTRITLWHYASRATQRSPPRWTTAGIMPERNTTTNDYALPGGAVKISGAPKC